MKTSKIFLLVFVLSLSNVFSQHKLHTDGVEPYYPTKELASYLTKIDSSYLKYMFASEENMKWWKEAKSGVFIHWAPSVVFENALSWGRNGRRPHHSTDGTVVKGTPEQEYNDSYKHFNPTKFDAEAWVLKFKSYGAKYFVFTAKHHYGFCMWDTKTTDFNIMNTPYKKDIMKEIADACHKHDMKLMWYYSQPDWTHELYRKELPHIEYNEKILYPQIKELMTNYGKIDGIWFDGLGKNPTTWDSPKTLKIIRDINPKAIVNHRHGSPQWHMGDFDGPERGVGRFQTNRPWETCEVIGHGWSYRGEKDDPIETKEAITLLTKIAGNGGNLLIGTGPRPDGSIVEKHDERLKEYGEFLQLNGETIYKTQAGPYIQGAWGSATYTNNKIWLHLTGVHQNNKITLPHLPASIKKIIDYGTKKKLSYKNKSSGLTINIPKKENKFGDRILEIELLENASTIKPIETFGTNILPIAKVTASSNASKDKSIANLTGQGADSFLTGIRVKKSWSPDSKDSKPTLYFEWPTSQTIHSLSIKEGSAIIKKTITDFKISAKINGDWVTLYRGNSLGTFFGLTFEKPIETKELKFEILKGTQIEINKFGIFSKK